MHLYLIAKVLFLLLSKDVDVKNADVRKGDLIKDTSNVKYLNEDI